MLTASQTTKFGLPSTYRDRLVVRCLDSKFGLSSKENPMITLNWEVVGKPTKEGGVETEITYGGQKYSIAGQRSQPVWLTLKAGAALENYFDFQRKAELPADSVDETNPDLSGYDNLCMEAICSVKEQPVRAAPTPEQAAAGEMGDPILDKDGKQVTRGQVVINQFLCKYTGSTDAAPY